VRPVELSPRLLAIAHQVPMGARFADIGTDHARLPVWLLEHGRIPSAIAADLKEGPLSRARQTAARHDLTERISFRLGDGLTPLGPEEADAIAIAGMGGETIASILGNAPWASGGTCLFYLQPMTSVPDLRRWLWRNGFVIEREELVREDKLYVVLTARGGEMAPLTPAEEWCGKQDRDMTSPYRGEYLSMMLSRAERALEGLGCSARLKDQERAKRWRGLVSELKQMKEEWIAWQR